MTKCVWPHDNNRIFVHVVCTVFFPPPATPLRIHFSPVLTLFFYCGWAGHVCRWKKKKNCAPWISMSSEGNSGAFQFGVSEVFIETGGLLGTHIIYILIHIHGLVQCSEMTLLRSALVWVIIIILPTPTYTHVRTIEGKSAVCCR